MISFSSSRAYYSDFEESFPIDSKVVKLEDGLIKFDCDGEVTVLTKQGDTFSGKGDCGTLYSSLVLFESFICYMLVGRSILTDGYECECYLVFKKD